MPVTIRGVQFVADVDNPTGLEFDDLSHRFGFQSADRPYFENVKIEHVRDWRSRACRSASRPACAI